MDKNQKENKENIDCDERPLEDAGNGKDAVKSNSNGSLQSPRAGVDVEKRKRTFSSESDGWSVWGGLPVSASPPKFVSLEEIMAAADGLTNMALAHEIAVDHQFKLELGTTKEDKNGEQSLYDRVKNAMHQAFWDVLREELSEDPPSYNRALILMEEIKESLISCLLPHQSRLKAEVHAHLDIELIKQQAEAEALDLFSYLHYVVSMMARLCAPARDDDVARLKEEKDIVELFRGIMETLKVMRIDLANFAIHQIRPYIQAQSVEYERKKFNEFLEAVPCALNKTKAWLGDHCVDEQNWTSNTSGNEKRAVVTRVINKAFMAILTWEEEKPCPETLALDEHRFWHLRDSVIRLSVLAAMLLVTCSGLAASLEHSLSGFRERLKGKLKTLLLPFYPDGLGQSDEDEDETVKGAVEVVIKEVGEGLKECGQSPLSESQITALRQQLQEITSPDHRVRQLAKRRVLEFISSTLSAPSSSTLQVPSGLTAVQTELGQLTASFLRLTNHNRLVFVDHYADIIEQHLLKATASKDE